MTETFDDFLNFLPFVPGILLAFFTIFMVHELGHYLVARAFGMKVDHFAVGFGRRLWQKTDRRGTTWSLHLFPFIGYVHIDALSFDEGGTGDRSALGKKALTVLAGPAANILLPFIILPLCFLIVGFPAKLPFVSAVENGKPAKVSGLQQGDEILGVDGKPVINYAQTVKRIENSGGRTLSFRVAREGEIIERDITPELRSYREITGIPREKYMIGILSAPLGMSLSMIERVNEIDTKDDPDKAREILQERLGQPINIGVRMGDDRIHVYNVIIPPDLNPHLYEEGHHEYDSVFLGPQKDNRFLDISPVQDVMYGLKKAGAILGHLLHMPLQLFPVDPEMKSERISFLRDTAYFWQKIIYKYAYDAAIMSLIIGFVNLLPFPRLDGDYLVAYALQSWKRRPPERKERALAMAGLLFLIYCIVLFANLGDIPTYIDYKLEMWHRK